MLRAKQPPSVRHCKVDSMEQAKDKKLQAGAVPDAHDKHGEDCRSRYHMKEALWGCLRPARDLFAQPPSPGNNHKLDRTVQIGANILRQRHMPTLPEVDDIESLVRRAEIERKIDRKHSR